MTGIYRMRMVALLLAGLTAACSTAPGDSADATVARSLESPPAAATHLQIAAFPVEPQVFHAAQLAQNAEEEPTRELEDFETSGDYPIDIYDPLEGFNRGVYRFNTEFDRLIFNPVLQVYEFIAPEVVKDGVSNFFSNLGNLITFGNELLQLKPVEAGQTAFRFAVNVTFGALGFFDAASEIDVPQNKEDFGQTLGYWGVGDGPYLVLPILGPSNLRDTTGFAVDTVAFSVVDPFGASSFQTDYPAVFALNIINQRREVPFEYYQTGSPFEYDLVRYFYTRKREFEIAK